VHGANVLTRWIVTQVSRIAPSPFSSDAQALISKYAPPKPEAERQFRELALVVAHSLPMIVVVAVWGLVAWIVSSGGQVSDQVVRVGWSLTVVLIAGLVLHLIRYYDALGSKARGRVPDDPRHRWPRVSSDLDLLVQAAIGVVAFIAGAPA
jgi:type III secretory pathway component EscS